jgi:hypothetical protein
VALSRGELATTPNLWPLISAEIPASVRTVQALSLRPPDDLIRSLVVRYEMGERLYRRDFLGWDREQFDQEIACELADTILYVAMRKIVIGEA